MRDDFDKDWPHGHTTRDGRSVRLLCTDAKGGRPIVALIGSNEEFVSMYPRDGRVCRDADHPYDLVNAPAPKRTFELWFNFYPSRGPDYFNSKEDADDFADRDRISRKCYLITEGEFDD